MPLASNRILLKYNKEITPFKNIKLGLTLTFQFVIFIDNSMICSDIWRKYHDWYFEIDVISRAVRRETIWVEYAKHHVQIMLLFVYTYYPQKFRNFHMQEFQIKLKYHCSKPIKLQKFLMYWYKPGNKRYRCWL